MIETFQLSPSESSASLVARLRRAEGDRVLLAVPEGLYLSEVDLRVLRREAAGRRLGLALLTGDPGLRQRAAQAGISTFRGTAAAERSRWRPLRPDEQLPMPPVGSADPEHPHPPGLGAKPSPSGFRPAPFRRAFVRMPHSCLGTLGLALVLVALLGGLLYVLAAVVPAATVRLTPAAEPAQVTVTLKAVRDAGPDIEAGVVPARALSVQLSGEARIPTSGQRLEPSARAQGRAVLINRTPVQLVVPGGTLVGTATGNNVQFVTLEDAPLLPNGRASVPIEAVIPGPEGNVRAGTITRMEGPLALSVLVSNEAPTDGGGSARVGVVTEEDQRKLQALLGDELREKAFAQLNERLEPGTFVPPESVSFIELSPTFTPFVGEVSPDLNLSMGVQAVGLVVDPRDGQQAALARLRQAIPPGTRLISDTIRFIPGSVTLQDDDTVEFTVTAEGTLLRGIDEGQVRSSVLGLSPEQAGQALTERFLMARPPEISLGPDWLPYVVPSRMPVLPWRIKVLVDWDGGAEIAMQSPRGS